MSRFLSPARFDCNYAPCRTYAWTIAGVYQTSDRARRGRKTCRTVLQAALGTHKKAEKCCSVWPPRAWKQRSACAATPHVHINMLARGKADAAASVLPSGIAEAYATSRTGPYTSWAVHRAASSGPFCSSREFQTRTSPRSSLSLAHQCAHASCGPSCATFGLP